MKMMDNRIALPKNYELHKNNLIFYIDEEIGRGANGIVYDASYLDSAGLKHLVRVKELYPIYLPILRSGNYEIGCDESHAEKFEEAKKRFETTYEKNVKFKNTYGVMNSTVNVSDKFCSNGTIYVVMNMDEGTDYRRYQDGNLVETMTHVKALASVIRTYHKDGYLHLDIKPENVFVIPETAEHVYLFDFDSVCRISDLQSKKIIDLSYSEGFSAPEQVQGNISRIGVKTDIYAIGALLFYKLFNRKPTFEECRYSAVFNYKEMVFYDERLRPGFFKCLDEFLHKTLATSPSLRWNSMDQVITILEDLVELSDCNNTYLIDTFTYNSASFVGRSEELEEIHEVIQNNHVLFLSGIGGIGKTELAKKFISEYRKEFDTAAFVYFQESVEHTVCQEILINNMYMDEEEEEKDYFERVLEVLRKNTTERDLILLDNFDVERDDKLEELLKCPCKFLITTRNRNIHDWNYNEIKIDRMDNMDDLRSLFITYNDEKYETSEYEVIGDIINFVDGHTMTVELISKYLRDSGQQPSVLYQRFREKSGVTNTDDRLMVNQRKDFKMNSESVNEHLSILFDVSEFDDVSKEIISSLSLFAGIRINRERFEGFCLIENIKKYLDKLMIRGWIERNELTGKISLHQVIQDLIYTKLSPTSENCPHIVAGMYQYIKEDTDNYFERRIKRKVFCIFAERINGNDISYARICLEYGKRKKIEEAINICQKIGNEESYGILTELYMENIRELCKFNDIFDNEDSFEEYGKKQVLQMDGQFELAIESFRRSNPDNQEKLLPGLIRLGNRMDSMLNEFMMSGCFDDVKEVDLVYQKIIGLFDNVKSDFLNLNISYDEKEKLLEIVRDFYSDDDFCAMYRCEHYADFEKVFYYQELLDELRKEKESAEGKSDIYIHAGDRSYSEIADGYMSNGDYKAAIKMYKKAYEEGDEALDWVNPRLSEAYLQIGDMDSAIEVLEEVLDYDKRCIADETLIGHYSGYICIDLIKILADAGRVKEAKIYAQELIRYQELEIQNKEDNSYYVKEVLAANWYLYFFSDNQAEKELLWSQCKELFNQLGDTGLQEEHFGFIREFIRKEKIALDKIIGVIERFDPGYEKQDMKIQLIEELIDTYDGQETFMPYHIQLLIKCAEITGDYLYKGSKNPLKYCEKAKELLVETDDKEGYLENKIIQVKAEIMSNDNVYEYDEVNAVRKQCNYYIIAEHECSELDYEQKIEIWNNAADNYGYVDDYVNQSKCLEQSYSIMIPILNQYDYSRFDYHLWNIMYKQVMAWIKMGDCETATGVIREMYVRTLDSYETGDDEKRKYRYKIKEIADLYEQAEDYKHSMRGYLMWIYVTLSETCDKRILNDYFDDIHDMKVVCEELMQVMTNARADDVDSLIDFKDAVEKLNIEGQELQIIQPLLDIITRDYQNKDIEFK